MLDAVGVRLVVPGSTEGPLSGHDPAGDGDAVSAMGGGEALRSLGPPVVRLEALGDECLELGDPCAACGRVGAAQGLHFGGLEQADEVYAAVLPPDVGCALGSQGLRQAGVQEREDHRHG